jgi:thioredoxin 1
MNQWIRRNLGSLVVIGAAVLIAGFSFRARSNTTPAAATAEPPTVTETQENQEIGVTPMLSSTTLAGTVHHADESNFSQVVLQSDVPVLVDFYADWCGPCRALAPVLEDLAQETADAKIVKVNVDHSPQLAEHFGISSIPSLKVFKDGEIVAEHLGLAPKAALKKMLGL